MFFMKDSFVFASLDRKSKIDPCDDSSMASEGLKGNVEFQHVSFRYPARPDVQIFSRLFLVNSFWQGYTKYHKFHTLGHE